MGGWRLAKVRQKVQAAALAQTLVNDDNIERLCARKWARRPADGAGGRCTRRIIPNGIFGGSS